MSLRYLLDTNVISEPLRTQPQSNILAHMQQHQTAIAIASVVWHELLFGCDRLSPSARRVAIEHFLYQVIAPTIPILPYDEQSASWHAREQARLVQIGRTPSFADGQIAAIAQTNQLTLITFNIADYTDFEGLTIEDWRE